jgi:subtilisin family serine protease
MYFKLKLWLTIQIVIFSITSCSNDDNRNPVTSNISNNHTEQYIVIIEPSNLLQSAGSFNAELAAKSILASHTIPYTNVTALYDKVLTGFCAKLTFDQVSKLQKDKRITQIEKDQPVYLQGFLEHENKKFSKLQGQSTPWGITAVGGSFNATTNTGVAWIVDTGVDLDHTELNVNTTLAKSFVPSGQDALSAEDLNGHGTHIAGIIAAKNNSNGVTGVCAGATVIPVKVLNRLGVGSMSQIISGLNYIAGNLVRGKINVVNLSLGGSAYTLLDNAVTNLESAGAYIVIAAGNSYKNSNNYSPAKVNGTNIFTISAFDNTGKFASWSNWANAPIDYSAPGVSIYSTYKNGGYATMSGTSMACPHVVGILLANNGTINYSGTVTNDPDGTADLKAKR